MQKLNYLYHVKTIFSISVVLFFFLLVSSFWPYELDHKWSKLTQWLKSYFILCQWMVSCLKQNKKRRTSLILVSEIVLDEQTKTMLHETGSYSMAPDNRIFISQCFVFIANNIIQKIRFWDNAMCSYGNCIKKMTKWELMIQEIKWGTQLFFQWQ